LKPTCRGEVALASTKAVADDYAALMRQVRDDEAHWCNARSAIRRLGERRPRDRAFREKALAIADPLERLAFLNRGQGWVVRKLVELLPRVRDDALHADLNAMVAGHRTNIDIANAFHSSGS
jgi:hypothetical protein